MAKSKNVPLSVARPTPTKPAPRPVKVQKPGSGHYDRFQAEIDGRVVTVTARNKLVGRPRKWKKDGLRMTVKIDRRLVEGERIVAQKSGLTKNDHLLMLFRTAVTKRRTIKVVPDLSVPPEQRAVISILMPEELSAQVDELLPRLRWEKSERTAMVSKTALLAALIQMAMDGAFSHGD